MISLAGLRAAPATLANVIAMLGPMSSLLVAASMAIQPPTGETPFEPGGTTPVPASAATDEEETPDERLERWKRHRTSLVATVVLSGLSLLGGAALLGIGVVNARATSDTPIGSIVGGSLLTAVGVAGVVGASVGLVRHERRRAEIAFSPTRLTLRF